MTIKENLEKIGILTDDINSMGEEFEELKKKYHKLDACLRDLYVERKERIKELMTLCEM